MENHSSQNQKQNTLKEHQHQEICGLHKGILKGKYHCTIDLLFDWFGLVCCKKIGSHAADSKLVKQEVNSTVIHFPL
jgi:hypothetical protein